MDRQPHPQRQAGCKDRLQTGETLSSSSISQLSTQLMNQSFLNSPLQIVGGGDSHGALSDAPPV